jgi:hypothetical protein
MLEDRHSKEFDGLGEMGWEGRVVVWRLGEAGCVVSIFRALESRGRRVAGLECREQRRLCEG